MSALAGITVRPLAEEDFEAAHALLALDEEHALGRPSRSQVSDLRAWLESVDLAQDTWLLEEDGRLIGFGWHDGQGELDSENPTGATKLYESVGMAVEVEQVVFEKALA